MTGTAALPDGERRPAFALAVTVVAYLFLAPPLFLLAPLAALLLFSRPRAFRELLWLGLAGYGAVWIVLDLRDAAVPARVLGASGLLAAGVFIVATHALPRTGTLERAAGAVAAALVGVLWWARGAGIGIDALDQAVTADLTQSMGRLLEGAPADQREAALASVPVMARVFPAIIILQVMGGLSLAWAWYHRVATRPVGRPPAPFPAFRFNDHLIWGAIFTLGLALAPLGGTFGRVAVNALVIWIGLYGLRGLAVASTAVRHWPAPGKLLIVVFSFLAAPIAVGTAVALGLADTWLDFRNRPVPGGGSDGSDPA